MDRDYDAIIVGARVAGAITATLLAERGFKVLLLDRAHFPSDTLSTHFFRSVAMRSFQRVGVFDSVVAAAPHLRETFTDVEGHTWSEQVDDEDGLDYVMCLRRITLDGILSQRVEKETNVCFLQGSHVTDLLRDGAEVHGVQWRDNDGLHQATSRVVIGADGFYSQVAKLVDAKVEEYEPVHRAMYYSYFQDLASRTPPAAEFYFRGDHLVYVFPTDADLTLIAISIPISEFDEFRKDATGNMSAELKLLPPLASRFEQANMVTPIKGAGNIPCYLRIPFGLGWALVGDSSLIFDPWSGQGIDHASMHAVMLADALYEFLEDRKTWSESMSQYHALRNASSKKNFESTRKFARDLRPMSYGALKNRGLTPPPK